MATTNISSTDFLGFNDNTQAVQLTSGTTAERPGSPSNGEMRYNTTDNKVEYYDGANWIQLEDFYIPNPLATQFLVVAGGGSGTGSGPVYSGLGTSGGGAGGLRTSYVDPSGGGGPRETAPVLSSGTTYTITVGGGGATWVGGSNYSNGNPGTDSSLSGSGLTTITSVGGGGGGLTGSTTNINGGSGGGSAAGSRTINNPNLPGGSGTTNQGFDGAPVQTVLSMSGGGGGGAGGVGLIGTMPLGGAGGAGLDISITGTSVGYAGGGPGGTGENGNANPCFTSGTHGAGDAGKGCYCGGSWPNPSGKNGGAGTANTGGAGGGGGNCSNTGSTNGGAGGSGVVILRMATSLYSGTTTGSPTVTTDGTDTILIYTGSGTYTH